jgi:serine-type D-Ala-D-Ala carboxypeptidase/endopeptidase (penicillin-binding protein 4)
MFFSRCCRLPGIQKISRFPFVSSGISYHGSLRFAVRLAQKNNRLYFPTVCLLLFSLSFQTAGAQCCVPDNTPLKKLLESTELKTAQVGVYVYDDSSKKIIADYQSGQYFVPASNTKLFSLYAGMKYLGDSLVGALVTQNDSALYVIATGDPSFLHPDFQSQPLYDLLKKTHKKIFLDDGGWREIALGPG